MAARNSLATRSRSVAVIPVEGDVAEHDHPTVAVCRQQHVGVVATSGVDSHIAEEHLVYLGAEQPRATAWTWFCRMPRPCSARARLPARCLLTGPRRRR